MTTELERCQQRISELIAKKTELTKDIDRELNECFIQRETLERDQKLKAENKMISELKEFYRLYPHFEKETVEILKNHDKWKEDAWMLEPDYYYSLDNLVTMWDRIKNGETVEDDEYVGDSTTNQREWKYMLAMCGTTRNRFEIPTTEMKIIEMLQQIGFPIVVCSFRRDTKKIFYKICRLDVFTRDHSYNDIRFCIVKTDSS